HERQGQRVVEASGRGVYPGSSVAPRIPHDSEPRLPLVGSFENRRSDRVGELLLVPAQARIDRQVRCRAAGVLCVEAEPFPVRSRGRVCGREIVWAPREKVVPVVALPLLVEVRPRLPAGEKAHGILADVLRLATDLDLVVSGVEGGIAAVLETLRLRIFGRPID